MVKMVCSDSSFNCACLPGQDPYVSIIYPTNNAQLGACFPLELFVCNFDLAQCGNSIRIFVDGVYIQQEIYSLCGPIWFKITTSGQHTIAVQLYDALDVPIGIADSRLINVDATNISNCMCEGWTGPCPPCGPTGCNDCGGCTGPTGPQGMTGPQGVTGLQGMTGPQGVQGMTGPQGVQGVTGPQGLQGVTGPQGVQGVTGPQGLQGVTGPQGVTGSQGLQGVTGPQGVQGMTGATGPRECYKYVVLDCKHKCYKVDDDVKLVVVKAKSSIVLPKVEEHCKVFRELYIKNEYRKKIEVKTRCGRDFCVESCSTLHLFAYHGSWHQA